MLFGTTYAQTAKIAQRLTDILSSAGKSVMYLDAAVVARGLSFRTFYCVIIGAFIIRGRHQRSVERFVGANREAMNGLPTAFFSVSGSAASGNPEERATARKMVDAFLQKTGWR